MKRFIKQGATLALGVAGVVALGSTIYSGVPARGGAAIVPAADIGGTREAMDTQAATDIRMRLTSIINEAVAHNGYDGLVGSLEKSQRNAITGEHFKDTGKLNDAIDQFRKDFKEQYKEDFNFKSALLDNAAIYQGADKQHADVDLAPILESLNVVKPATAVPTADGALRAALSTKELVMVKEDMLIGNAWRLQAATTPSARQLADSIKDAVSDLSNDKAKWPTEAKTAYLRVAKHVLKAVNEAGSGPERNASLR